MQVLQDVGISQNIFAASGSQVNGTASRFMPLAGDTFSSDESEAQIRLTDSIEILQLRILVEANSLDGNYIFAFRANGVTIASITIPATQTGELTTTVITAQTNMNDLVNFAMIADDATSGTITIQVMQAEFKSGGL